MKRTLLCLLAAAAALTTRAQSGEWQDAGVNAVNRMPMHAAYFAYESPEAARAGDRTRSERFLTLNGNWKFNWVRDADQRPADFFRIGYDDKGWDPAGSLVFYKYNYPIKSLYSATCFSHFSNSSRTNLSCDLLFRFLCSCPA